MKVQPVGELVELSRRCMTNSGDETDRVGTSVSNCNTLRRSASKRFKSEVSLFFKLRTIGFCMNVSHGVCLCYLSFFCFNWREKKKQYCFSTLKISQLLRLSGDFFPLIDKETEKKNLIAFVFTSHIFSIVQFLMPRKAFVNAL